MLAASVFNSGLLATPRPDPDSHFDYGPVPPDLLRRAERVADVCEAHGVTLPAAAMAFPLLHPSVACVVVGVRNAEEVRRNTASFATPIPPGLWTDLREESLLDARVPLPG